MVFLLHENILETVPHFTVLKLNCSRQGRPVLIAGGKVHIGSGEALLHVNSREIVLLLVWILGIDIREAQPWLYLPCRREVRSQHGEDEVKGRGLGEDLKIIQ